MQVWHNRFGHIGYRNLLKLPRMVIGMDLSAPIHDADACETCAFTKIKNKPHNSAMEPGQHKMDFLHSDVVGPLPVLAMMGRDFSSMCIAMLPRKLQSNASNTRAKQGHSFRVSSITMRRRIFAFIAFEWTMVGSTFP